MTNKKSTYQPVEVGVEDILHTLRTWKIHAAAGHNDGWVAEHYTNNIQKVQQQLDSFKKPNLIT
tara:strand:- start:990 stop:1181 length:192 start_codon:yes stop_codon:yes gene_type:complete